jgi:hypothetical protein
MSSSVFTRLYRRRYRPHWSRRREDPPPLAVGTYTVSPDSNPEGPALRISYEYGGCGDPEGAFTVLDITTVPTSTPYLLKLTSFTATFTQRCAGAGSGNVGCVHFQQ